MPTTLPSHYQCRVLFTSGLLSAAGGVMEPRCPIEGLNGARFYGAPGMPSVLIVGIPGIAWVDKAHGGRAKEAAILDPWGAPCVEALASMYELINGVKGVLFAPPVFVGYETAEDLLQIAGNRRIT